MPPPLPQPHHPSTCPPTPSRLQVLCSDQIPAGSERSLEGLTLKVWLRRQRGVCEVGLEGGWVGRVVARGRIGGGFECRLASASYAPQRMPLPRPLPLRRLQRIAHFLRFVYHPSEVRGVEGSWARLAGAAAGDVAMPTTRPSFT